MPNVGWIGGWVTLCEPAPSVVDPNPDGGKGPRAGNDEVRGTVPGHVPGDNEQSGLARRDLERTRIVVSRKLNLDAIEESFGSPSQISNDG